MFPNFELGSTTDENAIAPSLRCHMPDFAIFVAKRSCGIGDSNSWTSIIKRACTNRKDSNQSPSPLSCLVAHWLHPRYEFTHAVSNNTHWQLHRRCFGDITFIFPDSQAQPRGVGLCHMDRHLLFPDLCEYHYLARQCQHCGARLVRYWWGPTPLFQAVLTISWDSDEIASGCIDRLSHMCSGDLHTPVQGYTSSCFCRVNEGTGA